MSDDVAELTPLQRRTLDAIGRPPGDRVEFDPAFVAELRADADSGLAELTERLTTDDADVRLWAAKYAVTKVLDCEAAWLDPDPFQWNAFTARGTICHRAVQLTLNWRTAAPPPGDLVDAALELIAAGDASLGPWLAALGPADHADVRGLCVERVASFLEAFPPLQARWRPVTEAKVSYPATGPIVLSARPDLTIGVAAGGESRKVVIDLKSGRHHPRHLDDLRYYALLETLVRQIPPRLLVSYSLETCAPVTEAVTEARLRSALRRTLDAVERMVELKAEGRGPTRCERATCPTCHPDGPPTDDDVFD